MQIFEEEFIFTPQLYCVNIHNGFNFPYSKNKSSDVVLLYLSLAKEDGRYCETLLYDKTNWLK